MNILITSAGQRVSLVRSFQTELKNVYPNSKVFTVDLNPFLSPACHISDRAFEVPRVSDPLYINKLIDISIKNNVSLIIPTIDTELMPLSINKKRFDKKGIKLLVSDYDFIKQCRNKNNTNDFFCEHNISIPKQFKRDNLSFPVFVKPCDGSRSEGIFIAKDISELDEEKLSNDKLMFMEYISDKDYDEFTVDCYYDRNSTLKCVVPRQRISVRAGEVNKGATRKNIIVNEFRKKIHYIKGAIGCLTIQVFLSKVGDEIKGIEINPRFGGGYPLTYLSGANYSKWIIEEYFQDKSIEFFDEWKNNLYMLRYDAEVLVSE